MNNNFPKSQLLALLTFLVVLLSGVQALVIQFVNTTISAVMFGKLSIVSSHRSKFKYNMCNFISEIKYQLSCHRCAQSGTSPK